jgi:hypothetical protein
MGQNIIAANGLTMYSPKKRSILWVREFSSFGVAPNKEGPRNESRPNGTSEIIFIFILLAQNSC